ncbi:carbohydrate-binding protein [Neolewinella aurantiaca]|uniref:Carbohydrate-binding protein n=1 Tax=Neolewinella aurantiaca TaxID=2602767 RepID=A0A5C7FEB7_9BACT|nr:PQQ-dependent sugar dehydrogenase [Neolewinella aurantiaca]TXF89427.1 carbohydrate-binding protein [Neolewinella aurantiaca]
MHNKLFFVLVSAVVISFLLSACGNNQNPASEYISLPANGPVLMVGNPDRSLVDKLKNGFSQTPLTAPYRMLDEDSLFNHRNLVLLRVESDSLTTHRRRAVERFVSAGGRLLIVDDREAVPYEWAWYNDARSGQTGAQAFGAGQVLAINGTSPAPGDFFASSTSAAPAAAPVPVSLPAAPKADRFQLEVLDDNIYEPMEMEVLPDGNVLFLERRGKMKMWTKGGTKLVHDFPVCIEGNYEDGLHGLALDPGYGKENHWIYLYYSPSPCDSLDQLLSRFEFKKGVLDTNSEKVVLRVPVQRKSCCHSGGSVEFGADGLLYLSTGDNTSSKESDGYSPLDERPGRGPYDSQKSSGNTNDLRGKILRIKITPDGSYEIPEGNLFADGTEGKPEIYVMGARNPFRIAIDPWTKYLYWGDVGPDVGEDGRYGPQSYDEWNQAMTAGNYGWPYFVGNNFAYPDRDFATDEVGELFNAEAPINASPNNTGARQLPPARPALIWYPYGPSKEFPMLGTGSRSAMSGPFYDKRQLVPITNSALPDYYDGKWFIYEWARSWVKVVTLDSARQNIVQIEDFLPEVKFSKPIDFKIGPDGSVYVIEYGNDYFLNNPDARLVRISYSARNRPPVAILELDEPAGGIPFSPTLTAAESSDPDPGDSLAYRWFLDGKLATETLVFSPTITQAGPHAVRLEVEDEAGSTAEASVVLTAGNSRPELNISLNGNRSFLLPGRKKLTYSAVVNDPEDEASGALDRSQVVVNAAWVEDGMLVDGVRRGERQMPAGDLRFAAGEALLAGSDCYTCHKERSENIGPAYLSVAERYDDKPATITSLAKKVIRGGNGVWGERLMSAHPALSQDDAEIMVGYILSLNDAGRLPLRGETSPGSGAGSYVLAASYRDKGGRNAPPLVGQSVIVLRPTTLEAEAHNDGLYRAAVPQGGENNAFKVVNFRPGGSLRLANVHLLDLKVLKAHLHANVPGVLDLRYGAPDGKLLSSRELSPTEGWNVYTDVSLPLPAEANDLPPGDLYLVWKGEGGVVEDDMGHHRPGDVGFLDWLKVE